VGKFGLLQDSPTEKSKGKAQDIAEEALAVLAQLEYKKAEAVNMIKKALAQSPEIETTEELLNRVYKQKRK
jgi:Holliday junction resolvasome RuvABC DNA-binding subunit